jgi:5-methylcytosine-specific restriction endonuclease McrA
MSDCPHNNKKKVWTRVGSRLEPLAHGGRRLREQCQDCGRLLVREFAHALADPDTPEVDMERARAGKENEERKWQERSATWRRQRELESERWWDRYNEYLSSSEWFDRRRLVMERDGGLCQGCRERRATQVHHLTYKHVTNEFLWELVAICDVCHWRIHDIQVEGMGND